MFCMMQRTMNMSWPGLLVVKPKLQPPAIYRVARTEMASQGARGAVEILPLPSLRRASPSLGATPTRGGIVVRT